jgi:hypothetical protein
MMNVAMDTTDAFSTLSTAGSDVASCSAADMELQSVIESKRVWQACAPVVYA